MIKIINICGARPNFMKIAPLMRAYGQHADIAPLLVHTGQHYDENMSDLFFRQLGIPEPDVNLEVGSGGHAKQTAEIMTRFEPLVLEHQPDWVLVVGDVNSTIACGLVATKLGVRVAHVEAGLRSFDRAMPEEINRVLTDRISDLLFVTEPSGMTNLKTEGVPDERVHFVGNVMIDTLKANFDQAQQSTILTDLGLERKAFNVVTLHRPSNVDDARSLGRIAEVIETVQQDLPTVFPMHPRTRSNLARLGLADRFAAMDRLTIIEPVGYLDFLKLMGEAAVVLTDSGGIQGRDHHSGHLVFDPPREHGKTGDHRPGHQPPGGHRSRHHPRRLPRLPQRQAQQSPRPRQMGRPRRGTHRRHPGRAAIAHIPPPMRCI
jgi:UDP-N-acetylglucosamine 2-epimerase (non-hydrolysing)